MHSGNGNGEHSRRFVKRLSPRPVVVASMAPGYGAVFNAGLVHHEGRFHLFARAVRSGYRRNPGPGDRFLGYVSDIVVFTSEDGLAYKFGYMLAEAGTDGAQCLEDPRVQLVDGRYLMTCIWLPPVGSGLPWRIGAHRLVWEHGRFWLDGPGRLLGPEGVQDKDAVVFPLPGGRAALVHRVHPDMQLAVFDSLEDLMAPPDGYWAGYMAGLSSHTLIAPAHGALGVGAGAPPVETADGLLLFFHERRADGSYTMNVALLDRATGELLSRLPSAVLEPELEWERHGDVDNVVFVQGACRQGDSVYLAYGAADRCVGAAIASVPDLLGTLAARMTSPVFGKAQNGQRKGSPTILGL